MTHLGSQYHAWQGVGRQNFQMCWFNCLHSYRSPRRRAVTAQTNSALALSAANQGADTVNETIKRMGNISGQTALTEKCINDLDAYSKQIELITDTITNIAGQTNLLALNARH